MNESKEFLTVNEAAALLKMHPNSIRKYIKSGQLEAVQFDRSFRIRPDALRQLKGVASSEAPA